MTKRLAIAVIGSLACLSAQAVDVVLGSAAANGGGLSWVSGGGDNLVISFGGGVPPEPPAPTNITWGLTITTITNGTPYKITPLGATNLWVSWGDALGTVSNLQGAVASTFFYTNAGTYTISMSGTVSRVALDSTSPRNTYLQSVTPIGGLSRLTSLWYTFLNQTSLTNLPAQLLETATNLVTVGASGTANSGGFQNTGLKNVPGDMFAYNSKLVSLDRAFMLCYSLTNIEAGALSGATNVTSCYGTFSTCTNLTGTPDGLFSNQIACTDYRYVFYGCNSLLSLGNNTFNSGTNSTRFDFAFPLTTRLAYIPDTTFSGCPGATIFGGSADNAGVFEDSGLTNLPSGLFAANTNATTFERGFLANLSLKSIPAGLHSTQVKCTSFANEFFGCTGLIDIGDGVYSNCIAATTFLGTFRGCTALTNLPPNMFSGCRAITTVSNLFWGNIRMGGSAIQFWDTNNFPNITQKGGCYFNCTNLSDYGLIPLSYGGTNAVVPQ